MSVPQTESDFCDDGRGDVTEPDTWEILESVSARSGPRGFQATDKEMDFLQKRILNPAVFKFVRDNPGEDLSDVLSAGVIGLEKAFRTLLRHPAISKETRESREHSANKYLYSTVWYHLLAEYCQTTMRSEVGERLRDALSAPEVFSRVDGIYFFAGVPCAGSVPPEKVSDLASSLGARSASGYSAKFRTKLPTARELEKLACDAMAKAEAGLSGESLVDLAVLVFDLEENKATSLDAPVSSDSKLTQAEITAEEGTQTEEEAEDPVTFSLPHEVDLAEETIRGVLARLDSKPALGADRPFFHACFEFWLWDRVHLPDGRTVGGTEYEKLTGIADATIKSRRDKFEAELRKALKNQSPEAVRAALARMRERNVEIFRKKWGVQPLVGEAQNDE